ncbi:hypothetical protein [Actinophytocola sp.]|uniref:hypothetical protein n=1 Tax=Actinophytocola sp. TaxID=1872138 RepID=UPI002ED2267E
MSSSEEPRDDDLTEKTDPASDSGGDGTDEAAAGAAPETGAATPGPEAGRRKVLLISTAAVVVLAVVGLVVYLLTSGDDNVENTAGPDVPSITGTAPPNGTIPSAPPGESTPPLAPPSSSTTEEETTEANSADVGAAGDVAEQAANAISGADVSTLAELSCDPSTVGTDETFPDNATAEVVGEPQIDGDTATVDIKLTIEGAEPATVPIPLTKQDGRWCIP